MAIARCWPVAPSSAERIGRTSSGSERIASSVQGGSSLNATASAERDVRADHERDVASAPSHGRSAHREGRRSLRARPR